MVATEVRRAHKEDAVEIAAVLLAAFLEFKPKYTTQAFEATTPDANGILERLGEGPIWLATQNGKSVATASVVLKPNGLYVRGMAVLPIARGSGVAGLLFDKIDDYASANSCERQFLSTTPFLTRAIRFYERCGFSKISE